MINDLIDGINMDTLDKEKFKKLFKNKNVVDGEIISDIKGIAMFDKIIIDVDKFKRLPSRIQIFCLLHELCHSLRFDKLGTEYFLKMLANENFDEFADSVVNEEILADRYASIMFHKLTTLNYEWYQTQMLKEPSYRDRYIKHVIPMLFKNFKNKKAYEDFWAQFYKEK